MLEALERHFPAGATWSRPEGGLFCWATLPDYIDTTDLLAKALRENVAFVPGAAAYVDGRGGSSMRLNFSASPAGRDPRGHPPHRRRDRRAGRPVRVDNPGAPTSAIPRASRPGASRVRRPGRCSRSGERSMKVAVLEGRAWARAPGLAAQRRPGRGRADGPRPRGARRSTSAPTSSRGCAPSSPTSPSSPCTGSAARTAPPRSCSRSSASRTRVPACAPACARSTRSPPSRSCVAAGIPTPDVGRVQRTRLPRARRGRDPRRDRRAARLSAGDQARVGRLLAWSPLRRLGRGGAAALVAAFSYDDRVMLERHVDGRELAVSLINGIALPSVEARPARGGPLHLRGALRDRPHRVPLPGRARRRRGPRPRRRAAHLGRPRLRRLRPRRHDPRRRRAAGARGERDPRPHRHLAAADGRRGGRDRLRAALRRACSSSHSSAPRSASPSATK